MIVVVAMRFAAADAQEHVHEESGWKNVHGDVFRPPRYLILYAALLGARLSRCCSDL